MPEPDLGGCDFCSIPELIPVNAVLLPAIHQHLPGADELCTYYCQVLEAHHPQDVVSTQRGPFAALKPEHQNDNGTRRSDGLVLLCASLRRHVVMAK